MFEIYFDNGATTKPSQNVADIMYETLTGDYGNPSSLHSKGLDAEHVVKNSRKIIADSVKASADEIIFTASGSEANNLAIIGAARMFRYKGEIITSKVEHKCVLECMNALENDGFKVHYLDVDENGVVSVEQLKSLLNKDTQLVSIMHVNNECGAVQPINEIYAAVKEFLSILIIFRVIVNLS